ncbi:hypothetical protein PR202_ga02120 [Eleusine coracana subsp. coracana]|uniref:Uncharacterized protein n=1 Tax=Eleusine coracana subsp. coracana TaxID=191504 RepID=A0AAV5BGV7_ELECO|nr:hypothetical protein PR202_ga01433 [Eleusine coracana subsp. coracana]GJM86276.1 hypothetical protein PR202_ga02120 [Eleusine coracana subsp. coracana]
MVWTLPNDRPHRWQTLKGVRRQDDIQGRREEGCGDWGCAGEHPGHLHREVCGKEVKSHTEPISFELLYVDSSDIYPS